MIINAPSIPKLVKVMGLFECTEARKAHLVEVNERVALGMHAQKVLLMTDRFAMTQSVPKRCPARN